MVDDEGLRIITSPNTQSNPNTQLMGADQNSPEYI